MLKTSRLFQHVKMKALVQAHRFKVFTIVDMLIAHQRDGTCFLLLQHAMTDSYLYSIEGHG